MNANRFIFRYAMCVLEFDGFRSFYLIIIVIIGERLMSISVYVLRAFRLRMS